MYNDNSQNKSGDINIALVIFGFFVLFFIFSMFAKADQLENKMAKHCTYTMMDGEYQRLCPENFNSLP